MHLSPISNDSLTLEPRVPATGPKLTFDLPGVRIGVAEYEAGPTGCTVLHFPTPVQTAIDIRGGHPGTLGDHELVDAITLAGGSLYGLEAATGVAAELFAQRGLEVYPAPARVVAAVIFDYGSRDNTIYPDKELGRAAMRAARSNEFPLGRRGAGRAASVGKVLGREWGEPGGQGAAYRQIGDTKLAVFTVVNAVGAIVDRDGKVVRGHIDPAGGRRSVLDRAEEILFSGNPQAVRNTNTTLTVVVTNERLDELSLQQLGRHVHDSMARAIQPFHTLFDGDVLYAVTTAEVESEALNPVVLAMLASELAWDAVLSSVTADRRGS